MPTDIKIDYRTYTHVTREAEHDQWDRDSTASTHDIRGAHIAKRYGDLTVTYPVKEGSDYWLVYALYSTGDSFGTDEGQIEFIEMYQTYEEAKACKIALEVAPPPMFNRTIVGSDGVTRTIHIPWDGYFENLERVVVERVTLI